MVQYVAQVTATSNSTTTTQDVFLEIGGVTGAPIKVKRVRISVGSGTQTGGLDGSYLVQFYRYTTTTGSTTTSLTLAGATYNTTAGNISTAGAATGNVFMTKDPNLPQTVPTGLTVKAKAATTTCAIGTGTIQILDQIAPNGRATWEYLARDDDDMWRTLNAGFFAIAITSNLASTVYTVTCDFVI